MLHDLFPTGFLQVCIQELCVSGTTTHRYGICDLVSRNLVLVKKHDTHITQT